MANGEDSDIREALDSATEQLLALAEEARRAFRESETARIEELYRRVRERANEARGPARAVYEVAEAYLRALARGGESRDSLALLRFVEQSPTCAELIAKAASATGAPEDELASLPPEHREQVTALLRDGLLVAANGRLAVRPALRPVARDLVGPPILRMWKQVQTSRAQLALAQLGSSTEQARTLAGLLAVTEAQAKAHLGEFPLMPAATSAQAGPSSRAHTQYRRPTWVRHPVVKGTAEDEPASVPKAPFATSEQTTPPNHLATSPELN